MKRLVAILGASTLGIFSFAAAAPAQAADVPPDCENLDFENLDDLPLLSDCVPQYGLGKAEFTIVPDKDNPSATFPEGFTPLNELTQADVTSTTSPEDIADYFGDLEPEEGGYLANIIPLESGSTVSAPYEGEAFADALADLGAPAFSDAIITPTSHTYDAAVITPVASVSEIPSPDDVPEGIFEACATDAGEWFGGILVNYDPIWTTFSQTVGGENWNYTITANAKPTYILIGDIEGENPVWCASDGTNTVGTGTGAGLEEFIVVLGLLWTPLPDGEIDYPFPSLGVFSRDVPVAPVTPSKPVLAATGNDVSGAIALAGGLGLLGASALAFGALRRRRSA